MKSQNQEKPSKVSQSKPKKRRFKIEKLEERIAPRCGYNPNGKHTGGPKCYRGRY